MRRRTYSCDSRFCIIRCSDDLSKQQTALKNCIRQNAPLNALELGCGLGLFADYFSKEGIKITAGDFLAVAIEKARNRVREGYESPHFHTGDVTNLKDISGPFDVSYDVGCFDCLDEPGQMKYAREVNRLLKPDGVHLIRAMDISPRGMRLTPQVIEKVFGQYFERVSADRHYRQRG
ncbi:TPA: class I SAM-dependent methyltransferase [Kluyvera georgiana]|nr:class I SAM-dependent methyltransferase [Kluyvera georgiana]